MQAAGAPPGIKKPTAGTINKGLVDCLADIPRGCYADVIVQVSRGCVTDTPGFDSTIPPGCVFDNYFNC